MEEIDNDDTVEVIGDIFKSQIKLVEDLYDIQIRHCERMIDVLGGKKKGKKR